MVDAALGGRIEHPLAALAVDDERKRVVGIVDGFHERIEVALGERFVLRIEQPTHAPAAVDDFPDVSAERCGLAVGFRAVCARFIVRNRFVPRNRLVRRSRFVVPFLSVR